MEESPQRRGSRSGTKRAVGHRRVAPLDFSLLLGPAAKLDGKGRREAHKLHEVLKGEALDVHAVVARVDVLRGSCQQMEVPR